MKILVSNSNALKMLKFSLQQANFIALEDLRDDCKTELEMLNGKASKEN